MTTFLQKLPFYHQRWFQLLCYVIIRFEKDHCRDRAAALTYTTMLSLIPMLTVFLVVVSTIPALAPARNKIQSALFSNLLPATGSTVSQYLNDFSEKSANLTIIGVLFLFVTSIMMLSSIEDAFNKIWRVKSLHGGAIGLMRYWMIISLGPLFMGSAFALASAITSINFLNSNVGGYSIDWSVWLKMASVALTLFSFTFMYWIIPNRKVPFRHALWAGIGAGLTFEILKSVFGYVMAHFTSYEVVYGAFAALPIFLMWIYLSWNIVLLGVEMSYALTMYRHSDLPARQPILSLLYILHLLYMSQKSGNVVTEANMMSLLGKGEVEQWPYFIDILINQNLVKKTDRGDYVLCRNLDQLDFWTFSKTLPYPLPHREDLKNCNVHMTSGDEWSQRIIPFLSESDQFLEQHLSIPLSLLLEPDPLSDRQT